MSQMRVCTYINACIPRVSRMATDSASWNATSDSRLDERPCGWSEGGNARRDACDWVMVGRVMEGYWVDDCPLFVLQIRGNLLAIVALCLFTSQKAESGDFSSTEPMTSRLFFFFKSSSVGFSLALLSSLSFFFFFFNCLPALFWIQCIVSPSQLKYNLWVTEVSDPGFSAWFRFLVYYLVIVYARQYSAMFLHLPLFNQQHRNSLCAFRPGYLIE